MTDTLNVLDFIEEGDVGESPATQRALDALQSVGKGGILRYPPGRSYSVVGCAVRNDCPVVIQGYGSILSIPDPSAPVFTLYGVRHIIEGFSVYQKTPTDHCQFVAFKNNATNGTTLHGLCRDNYLYSVYRGFLVDMTAGYGDNFRHLFDNNHVENYIQQKTWSGSYGYKFTGDVNTNAGGNDTEVRSGSVKGYENNVIIQKSTKTTFTNVTNVGGGNAYNIDTCSTLCWIGGYLEYNDVQFYLTGNNYLLSLAGPSIALGSGIFQSGPGSPVNFNGWELNGEVMNPRFDNMVLGGLTARVGNYLDVGETIRLQNDKALQGYNSDGTSLHDLIKLYSAGGNVVNHVLAGDPSRRFHLSSADIGEDQRVYSGPNGSGPGGVGRALYVPNI